MMPQSSLLHLPSHPPPQKRDSPFPLSCHHVRLAAQAKQQTLPLPLPLPSLLWVHPMKPEAQLKMPPLPPPWAAMHRYLLPRVERALQPPVWPPQRQPPLLLPLPQ